jgi:5-methylthioadenosine/S-adenosylhomocysteine deaminase
VSGPPFDLAVRGGRFLTLGPEVADGSTLLVRGGLISGFAAKNSERPLARREIDASGRIIIPGLINAHTHAAMSLFRGLADDLPLEAWLARIWPAEAAAVSPEMVHRCTLLSMAEMLLSGTTLVADSYFFEEEVARAAREIGMRAVCGQGVLDFAAPDAPAGQGLSRLAAFLDGFSEAPLLRPAVFCHSVYACRPETLSRGHALARERGCLFFIHVAETAKEVRECVRAHGTTPLRLLERLGLLDESSVVVHGVHLDEGEVGLLAARGAALVHCPESNMKLASGVAPVGLMLKASVRLALGTDSAASNNDLDMLGEAGSAACLQARSGRALSDGEALRLATLGGADALGVPCGRLEAGRLADLAIIEPGFEALPEAPLAGQVLRAGAGRVRTVVVGGEVVVEEGRLTRIDLKEVMGKVRELARGLSA